MNEYDDFFNANRHLWNQRTAVHKDSSFYNLAGFKAGERVLTPIELTEVGDVQGKKMLHLQCHFGMDSLDWARLGAEVTGVDLSDEAIKEARQLNDELGMNATFICANVYDLHTGAPHAAATDSAKEREKIMDLVRQEGAFDIVFTSYGTIGWLPDLTKWAEIIAYYLKPGGIFYMADFHPVVWMFDDEFTHIQYAYENRELIVTENYGTYTDRKADIKGKEYSWNHSTSELLNALIGQGLQILHFNEFMYSPYANFTHSTETAPGQWQIRGMEGKIPMVYSLKTVKK